MITWEDVRRSRMNWKLQRETQYRASEKPLERELPPHRAEPHPRLEQGELEGIVAPIDDYEAFLRHKREMANRWFGYYKACKDKKKKSFIIDQYNKIALMKQR